MKRNYNKHIISVLLLLLAVSMLMTSCMGRSRYEDFLHAYEQNQSGTGGNTATTPDNPSSGGNNQIIIDGGAGDVSAAATAGLRSAVIINATHQNITASAGSGVIYRLEENGSAFIITNFHVVYSEGAKRICSDIQVYLYGMENTQYKIPASYVGGSDYYDLAILRVEKNDILKAAMGRGSVAPVKIADSDQTTLGQTAIAIGNAEGMGISITSGVVCVESEYITMNSMVSGKPTDMRVVRVDTAVNSGNSGGGLFNDKGELVGVVNAKIMHSQVENIGYAIPSNVVRAIADNIIDHCYGKLTQTVMRAILGITVTTADLSTYFDAETGRLVRTESIKVHEITAGGLGESILKVGDIVKSVSIGEKTMNLTRQYQLIDFLLDARVGDTVAFKVLRNGEETTVSVVLTAACMTAY